MDPVKIKTKKFPVPYRGTNSASDLKDFVDNVYYDLSNFADQITRLTNEITYLNSIQFISDEVNRNNIQLESDLRQQELVFVALASSALANEIDVLFNLYDPTGISFGGADEKHAYFSQNLGTVKPPRNGVANLFYYRDSLKNYKVISREPTVTFNIEPATSDFFLKESDTNNMFNGDNHLYWVREYSYAANNDVSEVTLEFKVDIPAGLGQSPNYLVLDPYPSLGLIINSITSNSGAIISAPIVNSGQVSVEVPAGVTYLTFNITQPTSRIQNGRKVFYLGFREIDAQKIAWDDLDTPVLPTPVTANHIILTKDLPKEVDTIESLSFDADVSRVIIKGSLAGVDDSSNLVVTRLSLNQGQLISPSFSFTGMVDQLMIEVYLDANAASNADRNGRTIDILKNITIRMS